MLEILVNTIFKLHINPVCFPKKTSLNSLQPAIYWRNPSVFLTFSLFLYGIYYWQTPQILFNAPQTVKKKSISHIPITGLNLYGCDACDASFDVKKTFYIKSYILCTNLIIFLFYILNKHHKRHFGRNYEFSIH